MRRISPNICGIISLTLAVGVAARRWGVQARQQIGELTEVVVAEMSSARADHHRQSLRKNIGPLERKPGELTRVVVEVDAVLAPRLAAIDQLKRPASERMEGMGNTKRLWLTARWRCNRQLTPIRTSNA